MTHRNHRVPSVVAAEANIVQPAGYTGDKEPKLSWADRRTAAQAQRLAEQVLGMLERDTDAERARLGPWFRRHPILGVDPEAVSEATTARLKEEGISGITAEVADHNMYGVDQTTDYWVILRETPEEGAA